MKRKKKPPIGPRTREESFGEARDIQEKRRLKKKEEDRGREQQSGTNR